MSREDAVAEGLWQIHAYMTETHRHKESLCREIVVLEIALMAAMIVVPVPSWYRSLLSEHYFGARNLFCISVGVFTGLVVLLFTFTHRFLLYQLEQRRVFAIWTKIIRLYLTRMMTKKTTKWDFEPIIDDPSRHHVSTTTIMRRFVSMFIFPIMIGIPESDMDSVMNVMPSPIVNMLNDPEMITTVSNTYDRFVATVSIGICVIGAGSISLRFLNLIDNNCFRCVW